MPDEQPPMRILDLLMLLHITYLNYQKRSATIMDKIFERN